MFADFPIADAPYASTPVTGTVLPDYPQDFRELGDMVSTEALGSQAH